MNIYAFLYSIAYWPAAGEKRPHHTVPSQTGRANSATFREALKEWLAILFRQNNQDFGMAKAKEV